MSSAFTVSVKGVEIRDRTDGLCMHAYLYKTGLVGYLSFCIDFETCLMKKDMCKCGL
jgi:hypothetical protein